jgi:hypothetical protein
LKWTEALRKGSENAGQEFPADLDIRLPYYGQILDDLASGRYSDPAIDDQGEPDEQAQPGIKSFWRKLGDEYLQKLHMDKEKRLLNKQPIEALMRVFDKVAPGVSRQTIREFVRDVWAYLARPGIQDEINSIVAQELTEQQPAIVVAHSLGSVVAYQILRTDRRNLTVPLYVTLGSPLGIGGIREQLLPLRFPQPIEAWYNARDKADYVALNSLDEQHFGGFVGKKTPNKIENYDEVEHGTADPHDVAGYLSDPTVARTILKALTG